MDGNDSNIKFNAVSTFINDFYRYKSDGQNLNQIVHSMGFKEKDDFDDICRFLGIEVDTGHELLHYGVKRRSGRYPYGSGDDPFQHEEAFNFINTMREYRDSGLNDTEIAKKMGYTTTEYRAFKTLYNAQVTDSNINSARTMLEDGHSISQIAERLSVSESTVRNYLKSDTTKMRNTNKQIEGTKDMLKEQIKKNTILDIGEGTNVQLGISESRLKAAVKELENEGYYVHNVHIYRLGSENKYTTIKTLSQFETKEEAFNNAEKIRPPKAWTDDGGYTFNSIQEQKIKSVDWDRVYIRHDEEGGTLKDGTIELRRGVEDLDMGDAHYAQVRIAVGDTHYLKGMAYYSDDIPKGYDIVFNTNKSNKLPKEEVLKKLKSDPENKFGATINRQKGAINIVNEEGDWIKWQHNMSAQFLSKQPLTLIKDRLDATYKDYKEEYETILNVKNPVIREYLLNEFSDTKNGGSLQSAARHLSAKGSERGNAEVILPLVNIKPTQIYAPNYKNGEKVVLIRYPHGGIFELPELTVNNNFKEGKKIIGNAIDAVGIHPTVATKLSGADFDGDTVYIFPKTNANGKSIKTAPSLTELKDFDPKVYKVDHETITPKRKQMEMGIVSNLITDMTIKGATDDELVRAVKHSMVVIDSEKHHLDYKQSAIDNSISALHKKYQGKATGGASTLISKAKKNFDEVDESTGNKRKAYLMDTIDDAYKLSSGTVQENAYAGYINKLKSMANQVEKDKIVAREQRTPKDKAASIKYENEVASLKKKLNAALSNIPQERAAQTQAYFNYKEKKTTEMTKDDLKKLRIRSVNKARDLVGAKGGDVRISITEKEWEAIDNNAISPTTLSTILKYSDSTQIKEHVTPIDRRPMSNANVAQARSMLARGIPITEVAKSLGYSESAIRYNVNNK